jgi:hypothetical protein
MISFLIRFSFLSNASVIISRVSLATFSDGSSLFRSEILESLENRSEFSSLSENSIAIDLWVLLQMWEKGGVRELILEWESWLSILDLERHDKVSIAFSCIFCWNSLDDDRGEWILVFEAYIVFSYYRECLEEIFTIDTDDIFLSFDRSRDAHATGTYLGIPGWDFDDSFVLGSDSGIVVILSSYEIGLLESIDELTSENT